MPSALQLRFEAFADRFENVLRREHVNSSIANRTASVPVRVTTRDGASTDFRLTEVDLDGEELIGRQRRLAVRIPLRSVRAVSWHKRRLGRVLLTWATVPIACATAGALVAGFAGGAGGALFGAVTGIGVMIGIDKWEALYTWVPLFDSPAGE